MARVDDRTITAAQLGQAFRMRWSGVANETAALAARGPVLDRLVQAELMAAEALARGYGDTPEAKRILHAFETQLLVSRYLNQVLAADIRVTPEETQAYYDAHKESLHRPPRVHVHQVTVPTEEEASRLAGLVRQGTDIGWLARQHSTDGFKDSGGDRGWVVPGRTGKVLDEALLTAKTGEVLGPNAAAEGFAVVQVDAREEQGIYDFKEISGNVRKAVRDQKVEQAIDELVRKLRSRSKIEVHEDVLASLRITAAPAEEKAHPGGRMAPPEQATVRAGAKMRLRSKIGLSAVLVALGLAAGMAHGQLRKGARFEKGGTCTECHADVGKNRKVAHAPMAKGDCTACHGPTAWWARCGSSPRSRSCAWVATTPRASG